MAFNQTVVLIQMHACWGIVFSLFISYLLKPSRLHVINTSDNLSADFQIVLLQDYFKSLSNSSFILSMYGSVKAGG